MLRMRSLGRVYVGYETYTAEPKHLSQAWFRELASPWRSGHGVRLRLGTSALQLGFCRRVMMEEPSALSQLGGRDLTLTPHEIGRLGAPATEEQEPVES